MSQDENIATVVTQTASDIGAYIKSQREAAQVSIRQLAARAGVSNPYLSQIERGLRKPSAEVLGQIAKALTLSAEVLYVRAGILEPGESSQVRDAVINDQAITDQQKRALLDIYASFLHQNESVQRAAAPAEVTQPLATPAPQAAAAPQPPVPADAPAPQDFPAPAPGSTTGEESSTG